MTDLLAFVISVEAEVDCREKCVGDGNDGIVQEHGTRFASKFVKEHT